MVERAAGLVVPNIVSIVIYLLLMVSLGLYMKRKVKSGNDYWIGGRQIGPIVTALSYCATYYSSVAIIGSPSMTYRYGLTYMPLNMSGTTVVAGILVFAFLGLKMRVVSERAKAVSLPSYLNVRYESKFLGLIAGVVIAIMMVPYGVSVLKAIADAMNVLCGIPYPIGVALILITALFYLVSSGYWGIAITDMIQGVLIVFGLVLLAWSVATRCGGVTEVFTKVTAEYPKLQEFPGMFPSMLALFSTTWAWAAINFGQPQLTTKFFALKDGRTMGTVIRYIIVWMVLFSTAAGIVGMGARYLYGDTLLSKPDSVAPILAFSSNNQFIMSIFICAVVAAGLSTLVALALSASMAIARDIYQDFIMASAGKSLDSKHVIKVSRIITAIVLIIMGYFSLNPIDLVWEMSTVAAGAMGAAFTGPMLIGLYWKRSTKAAAILSAISGPVITNICFYFKLTKVQPFLPGIVAALIVFVLVSLCTKAPSQETIDTFFNKDSRKWKLKTANQE